jgi:hypothetical protein
LFGPEQEHNVKIDQTLWAGCEQVSGEDNLMLCKPFSEEEIKKALFLIGKKQSCRTRQNSH